MEEKKDMTDLYLFVDMVPSFHTKLNFLIFIISSYNFPSKIENQNLSSQFIYFFSQIINFSIFSNWNQ